MLFSKVLEQISYSRSTELQTKNALARHLATVIQEPQYFPAINRAISVMAGEKEITLQPLPEISDSPHDEENCFATVENFLNTNKLNNKQIYAFIVALCSPRNICIQSQNELALVQQAFIEDSNEARITLDQITPPEDIVNLFENNLPLWTAQLNTRPSLYSDPIQIEIAYFCLLLNREKPYEEIFCPRICCICFFSPSPTPPTTAPPTERLTKLLNNNSVDDSNNKLLANVTRTIALLITLLGRDTPFRMNDKDFKCLFQELARIKLDPEELQDMEDLLCEGKLSADFVEAIERNTDWADLFRQEISKFQDDNTSSPSSQQI